MVTRLTHEENRLSVVRTLDALQPVADAFCVRYPLAVHRSGGRRGGTRRGRRIFPRPSLRPTARLAIPAPGRRRRQDQPHRNRHGGDRHALREPALYGRGCGLGRPDRGRAPATGYQPRLARAGRSMAGATSAMRRRRARAMPTWPGATPRSSWRFCRAKASQSPIRARCSPIRPGCFASSRTPKGLRDRIWWGAATNATAVWAAKLGMNLQSSTLKFDESGKPFHVQQAEQIRAFREAWKEAGHGREPRVSVSRSIFALIDDRDRAYFGRSDSQDHFGYHRAGKAGRLRTQLCCRA